jgi:hypothetical protein
VLRSAFPQRKAPRRSHSRHDRISSIFVVGPRTRPNRTVDPAPSLGDNAMSKDIKRAKQFQKSLWEAAGWGWAEATLDHWRIHKPLGTDWDDWRRKGLVPVPFCAYCGNNDSLGGSQRSNVHSLLRVPVNLCSGCYARMAKRLGFDNASAPASLRVRLIERLGAVGCCLILVVLLLVAIALCCRVLSL